jgi:O-antigen ligase
VGAEILKLYYLGQPFVMAIALAVGVTAIGGAVISRPWVPLALYLSVFFAFAQSNYGSLDVYHANPIYARGSGQLFYPALCWALLVMVFWAWLGRRFASESPLPVLPVQRVLWTWVLLLALHLAAGLALGVDAAQVLDSHGFAQLAWMLPLVHLLQASGRDERTLDTIGRLLVLAALAKALFGLGRWAFFGGDPANVYQNYGQVDVRLTYFDLSDSLVCLLGASVAAAMLLVAPSPRQGLAWRLLCGTTIALAVLCIVLSYRRTAWGGLVLALGWLLWQLDRRRRWPVLLVVLPLATALVVTVAMQRLEVQGRGGGLTAFFFDLLGNRFGPESTRLLELRLAWQAFTDSPIVGIGAWGRYANSHLVPWQVMTGGSFVHSGVLHLAMKAGLVGLILLAALAWAFQTELRRAAAAAGPEGRVLLVAAVCGLFFMLPDFLFGTPIPQLRTMQLTAFCLGLPGLVAAASRSTRR